MVEFQHGQVVMTRGVNDRVANDKEFSKFVLQSLHRHYVGDWGELAAADKALNDAAVTSGEDRIFSAYKRKNQPDMKIWIITEADRSATTILFPSEY